MSEGGDEQIEVAIATYRRELAAAADVARGDLDEIEDHLRLLTRELREQGVPTALAVAEAARRLGEPHAIAREHARDRGGFGAPLSRMRAWSAAALLLVPFVRSLASPYFHTPLDPIPQVESAIFAVLLLGLVARRGWARAAILGLLPLGIVLIATMSAVGVCRPDAVLAILPDVGALAFVLPWRRRELSAAGWSVASLAMAYAMASILFGTKLNGQYGSGLDQANAIVGTMLMSLAAVGAVLRARWAAIAAGLLALPLLVAGVELACLAYSGSHPIAITAQDLFSLTASTLAALAAAVLLWRTGRSRLGELRYIAR